MLPTRDSLKIKRHRPNVKDWKKIFHANGNKYKMRQPYLYYTKYTLKQKL